MATMVRERQLRMFGHKSIDERFETFQREHPDVYDLFRSCAKQLLVRGVKHYGAKAIVEHIRFEKMTSSQGRPEFKIDNNFTSRLARKLIAEDGRFEEFFRTRRLRAE